MGYGGADGTRQKFTQKERDNESGLDWFAPGRYYSSAQARFTTVDPLVFGSITPTRPQTWNRYAYVLNNPLKYFDPLGLRWAQRQVKDDQGERTEFTWFDTDEEYDAALKSKEGWQAVKFDESKPFSFRVPARNNDEIFEYYTLLPNGQSGYSRDIAGNDSGIAGVTTDWNAQFIIGGVMNGLRGLAMGALEGLAVSGSRAAGQAAAEEAVTLWRAVTKQELDDLASGVFRNPAGNEVK